MLKDPQPFPAGDRWPGTVAIPSLWTGARFIARGREWPVIPHPPCACRVVGIEGGPIANTRCGYP